MTDPTPPRQTTPGTPAERWYYVSQPTRGTGKGYVRATSAKAAVERAYEQGFDDPVDHSIDWHGKGRAVPAPEHEAQR